MPGAAGGLGGAATGAAIGSFLLPGIGTAVGAGLGGLFGFFGGKQKKTGAEKMLEQRYAEMRDPNYMRDEFLTTARELGPSQSDVLGRLRASGLGLGQASALANQQYKSEMGRSREAANSAYSRFQLSNQQNANSLLGGILGASQQRRADENSFNNELLSGGLGLGGMLIGQGGFGGGSGGANPSALLGGNYTGFGY